MKKGQIYEGTIEKVLFPNKGQIEAEGRTVTVKNGLPGQIVRYQVTKVRKGKAEGRVVEVVKRAPLECEPACRHFADCGGCTWQNLPYEEQLRLKEQQVKALLDQAVSGYTYIFEGIKESPNRYGYRNKMEFSFGDGRKDGPLELGMHKRGSFYDIVTVEDCRIADEDFGRILKETLSYFQEQKTSFYHKMQHTGYLRHLLVRKAAKTGEILAALVTTTQAEEGEQVLLEGWKKRIQALTLDGTLMGLLHIKNNSLADVVQNDGTEVLFGRNYFYEELLGLRFRITPFSFFQTNSPGAEVLYETVRAYIGDTKDQTVYDLYSGTGTIAQILSPVAGRVIGVEIVSEAVEAARENAKENQLSNCEFLAGDVLKMLDDIQEKPDVIVLDPPRDGVHPKALKKIIDYGVDRIVYISCKPTSLARDLELLQACGYQVERGCCVDMFPWSGNVESIVLLSKLKSNKMKHINVELEMDELDLTAAESKATYEEIKDYVLKQSGLKVSNLYIAQVKQKCGIIERVNYNLPKSENSIQPKCPPEKEAAIREALEHFKMIQ